MQCAVKNKIVNEGPCQDWASFTRISFQKEKGTWVGGELQELHLSIFTKSSLTVDELFWLALHLKQHVEYGITTFFCLRCSVQFKNKDKIQINWLI